VRRMLANIVIVGFVGLLGALGVRTLILEDSRFGFGMFPNQCDYEVEYDWVLADGRIMSYQTGTELRGKMKYLVDSRPHSTRRGVGTVRAWVREYVKYVYDRSDPQPGTRFRAWLTYSINQRESETQTLYYPAQANDD